MAWSPRSSVVWSRHLAPSLALLLHLFAAMNYRAPPAKTRAATGVISTSIPLSTALPESGSRRFLVHLAHSGWLQDLRRQLRVRCLVDRVPHPCGKLITPGIISSVISTSASIARPSWAMRALAPSSIPSRAASSGLIRAMHRAAPLARNWKIVHPAIVAVKLAPSRRLQGRALDDRDQRLAV